MTRKWRYLAVPGREALTTTVVMGLWKRSGTPAARATNTGIPGYRIPGYRTAFGRYLIRVLSQSIQGFAVLTFDTFATLSLVTSHCINHMSRLCRRLPSPTHAHSRTALQFLPVAALPIVLSYSLQPPSPPRQCTVLHRVEQHIMGRG